MRAHSTDYLTRLPVMTDLDFSAVDQCVMCGLCLPHCPTYQLSRDEGESPRGRLALIKALGTGAVEADNPRLAYHLDRCLGCRACEAMCPSRVPYFSLMDAARARMYEAGGATRYSLRGRLALKVAASPTATRLSGTVSGLMGLKTASARPEQVRAGDARSTVSEQLILFTGCTSSLIDPHLARDAEQLLTSLGYEVIRSEPGGCCGALNRHAGNRQVADQQRSQNSGFFQRYPGVPVISLATGCSAEIQDYQDDVSARHQEITAFLVQVMKDRELRFDSDALRVAIHTPCTQRNVLKEAGIIRSLLSMVPGLELMDLPLDYGCCGAGGLNQIEQEDVGSALLKPMLDWLEREQPDVVVSPNAGCSLHMQNGMKQRGISCELTHPVQLLASLMKSA